MKSTFKEKLHKAFLEVGIILVGSVVMVTANVAVYELHALKRFGYHTGIFPYEYDGVVYGWVVTTLAGGVSFVSGAVTLTLLSWILQFREGRAEEKTFSLFSHDRGRQRLSREWREPAFVWLGVHAIYLLIVCFRSFWKDVTLTTALEDVSTGYVLSALLVSGGFVLVLALYKVLVKVPQLEFQTRGCTYFRFYCFMFWGVLVGRAIVDPVLLPV